MPFPDDMVHPTGFPEGCLLGDYVTSGAYVDCYAIDVRGPVSHAAFVEAFYTSALFKLERLFLGLFIARPSTDAQAAQLAQGQRADFAAWTVEARAPNQLVLAAGRTRSWLMVAPGAAAPGTTRLYFGSAVVPRRSSAGGRGGMGFAFTALLGFHRLYSRALLHCAKSRLIRQGKAGRQRPDDA